MFIFNIGLLEWAEILLEVPFPFLPLNYKRSLKKSLRLDVAFRHKAFSRFLVPYLLMSLFSKIVTDETLLQMV